MNLDQLLRDTEADVHAFCSPYSGNCFEVALALSRNHSAEGFCCVYMDENQICNPNALPAHITTQINGTLFDAGGQLDRHILLREYAPKQDMKLLQFESTFNYEHVVSQDITDKLVELYCM